MRACSRLVRPGGVMMVATLNRTLKSLALGKVMAEYVLRWVPAGTHDWRQFLKPEEIARMLSGGTAEHAARQHAAELLAGVSRRRAR